VVTPMAFDCLPDWHRVTGSPSDLTLAGPRKYRGSAAGTVRFAEAQYVHD